MLDSRIKFDSGKNKPKYAVSHSKTKVLSISDMGFILKDKDIFENFEIAKEMKSKITTITL